MRTTFVAILLALLTLAGVSYGQAIDANLVGNVVDATGAAVPNANIEIQNNATGVKNNTKTNADGQYRFNNIPIGLYNVTATAAGFATSTLKNVDIQLSKTSTANITLQVGSVSTSVDVSEIGAVIDTTTAQLQSNFEARQIVNRVNRELRRVVPEATAFAVMPPSIPGLGTQGGFSFWLQDRSGGNLDFLNQNVHVSTSTYGRGE